MKRFIAKWRAFPLAAALVLLASRNASGQIPVSDYASLFDALQISTVVTNFVTNSIITLSTVGQTLQITTNVIIDGGTNNIVIDGSSATRLFHVHPKCQLILNNLQLLNGISSSGGAVFNEGTLILSNCIISGNAATNLIGVNGTTNSSGGNGSSASSGGSATGGAIYSTGDVIAYYSVFGTNTAAGGEGGAGGAGGASAFFGGDGGNGGSGGSAFGAAIYSSGSNNVFFFDEFIDNQCSGGLGGAGGAAGSGSFDAGNSGQGGTGGSATGGALYVAGTVSMYGCLFYLNSATAGPSAASQVDFDGSGSDGNAGGAAVGGGLFLSEAAVKSEIENTVFFNNSCVGGGGGAGPGQSANGGNGGAAIGGGLDSAAARVVVRSCTMATNSLKGGAAGTGSSGSGSVGGTAGWDICANAGGLQLSDSILSGGTNQAPNYTPNAFGVTDAGYNVCSDASLAKLTSTTLLDANTGLDSGLAADGGPGLGPANVVDPAMLTLALLGGPAAQFIPGVAGITYPDTDELLQPRGSPASAGAFEFEALTLSSNSPPVITTQPVGVTNAIGATATFIVATSDTNGTGYQWQLNGTNLIDNAAFAGVTTSNLTVKKISAGDAGSYQVIVGVSTLEGVSTSAVAELVVKLPPKITVQPARKPNEPVGAIVSFRVTATGDLLSYQWRNGTIDLVDGGGISGSLTSNLVIHPATLSDKGTYSVVITNAYGAVTSISIPLNVVADTTKPTVSITSPVANSRTTNSVILGKATDNAQVTNVLWWITNINAGVITVTSNFAALDTSGTTTATWSISNAVPPGTNIVAVRSVDFSGNVSPVVTRRFFNVFPSIFALAVSGPGAVKGHAAIAGNVPPTNGAMLNIGEGYTLTATPGTGAVFTNWTSNGTPSYSPTLHFIMEPGLQIAAYFTSKTETAVHADEIYNGLFYDETNGVNQKTAGMLSQLTVNAAGAYSGKLLLNGASYSLAGKFDTSGAASNRIARSADDGGAMEVHMTLQSTNSQISGVVSGSDPDRWISTLFAEAVDTNLTSGNYTVLLLPSTNSPADVPSRSGHLFLANRLGYLAYRGALADGAVFSQATPLGQLGDVPLFANLYGNTGLVLGWVGLSNGTINAETPLAWIKSPSSSGPFANGFTNFLYVIPSAWTNLPQDVSPDATRQ